MVCRCQIKGFKNCLFFGFGFGFGFVTEKVFKIDFGNPEFFEFLNDILDLGSQCLKVR